MYAAHEYDLSNHFCVFSSSRTHCLLQQPSSIFLLFFPYYYCDYYYLTQLVELAKSKIDFFPISLSLSLFRSLFSIRIISVSSEFQLLQTVCCLCIAYVLVLVHEFNILYSIANAMCITSNFRYFNSIYEGNNG